MIPPHPTADIVLDALQRAIRAPCSDSERIAMVEFLLSLEISCPVCHGDGHQDGELCNNCGGSGLYEKKLDTPRPGVYAF